MICYNFYRYGYVVPLKQKNYCRNNLLHGRKRPLYETAFYCIIRFRVMGRILLLQYPFSSCVLQAVMVPDTRLLKYQALRRYPPSVTASLHPQPLISSHGKKKYAKSFPIWKTDYCCWLMFECVCTFFVSRSGDFF